MNDKQTPKTATALRRKFDPAFRQQALQMVANGQSVRSVAQNLGISENLLHTWKQKQQSAPHQLVAENQELRARLKPRRDGAGHLKKSLAHFQPADLKARYGFIDTRSPKLPHDNALPSFGGESRAPITQPVKGASRPLQTPWRKESAPFLGNTGDGTEHAASRPRCKAEGYRICRHLCTCPDAGAGVTGDSTALFCAPHDGLPARGTDES